MAGYSGSRRPAILPGLPGGPPLGKPEPSPLARRPIGFHTLRAAVLCGTSLGFTRAV